MEIPGSASYELDNGTISICRHFGAGEKPVELLSTAVARAASQAGLLTLPGPDGIIEPKFREPVRQTRRSDSHR